MSNPISSMSAAQLKSALHDDQEVFRGAVRGEIL